MDIDMTALRGLVREKEISFDLLVEAIEAALLVAYHHTEGAQPHARASSSTAGPATSPCSAARDRRGRRESLGEYDDTPEGFGRIAATTAKQVILQRLRDAEDERTFGEYAGKEGDIVSGVIQQGRDPRDVLVDLGKVEARAARAQEQVPGEKYVHGERHHAATSSQVRKGVRGPQVTLSRTHPEPGHASCSRMEVPEIADGSVEIVAHRPRGRPPHQDRRPRPTAPGVNAKGACIGPMGARVRAVMTELHGEKIDIVDWSEDPASSWPAPSRRPG